MPTTFVNHLKDQHEFLKFDHHCIRYLLISTPTTLSIMFLIIFCCSILLTTFVFLILLFKFLQYIRKLLFSDLDKDSITNVLKQLRKLPWSECEQYILKCFMKVHKGKYGQIHLIASLTSGLSRHHEEFAVAVVDEVCLPSTVFYWLIHVDFVVSEIS